MHFSSNLNGSKFLGALGRAHEREIEEGSTFPGVLLLAVFGGWSVSSSANVAPI